MITRTFIKASHNITHIKPLVQPGSAQKYSSNLFRQVFQNHISLRNGTFSQIGRNFSKQASKSVNKKPFYKRTIPRLLVGMPLAFYLSGFFMTSQQKYDVYGVFMAARNFVYGGWQLGMSALDYKKSLNGLEEDSDEYKEVQRECHQRCADRVLKLSQENGGIYLKFGQYIGNLERVIPK